MAKKKRGKPTILRVSLYNRIKFLFTGDFKKLVKAIPKVKPKKAKVTKPVTKPRKPRVKLTESIGEL